MHVLWKYSVYLGQDDVIIVILPYAQCPYMALSNPLFP